MTFSDRRPERLEMDRVYILYAATSPKKRMLINKLVRSRQPFYNATYPPWTTSRTVEKSPTLARRNAPCAACSAQTSGPPPCTSRHMSMTIVDHRDANKHACNSSLTHCSLHTKHRPAQPCKMPQRMKKVVHEFVSDCQQGFVPDGFIAEATAMLRMVKAYINEEPDEEREGIFLNS